MIARAFTLVELLVVILIISLLTGMAVWTMRESNIDIVEKAGDQVASVVTRARMLSIRSGIMHGITINIENAGDGSVLWNVHPEDPPDFPGRHWIGIVGPAKGQGISGKTPPLVRMSTGSSGRDSKDRLEYPLAQLYREAMEGSMVEPPTYLPRGTRFLALSDRDKGHDGGGRHASYRRSDGSLPVGRPWHGLYDAGSGRIHAWGGYNRDYESSDARTANRYEGSEATSRIPYDKDQRCNVHPAQVWGQLTATANAKQASDVGDTIDPVSRGSEALCLRYYVGTPLPEQLYQATYVVRRTGPDTEYLANKPRPVFDGLLADFMLAFEADGTALYAGGNARRQFFLDSGEGSFSASTESAVHEGRRQFITGVGSIFAHDLKQTGGYHLTICRDIDPEDRLGPNDVYDYGNLNPLTDEPYYDRVASADAYFHTITPYVRVFIPRFGGDAQVITMHHPDAKITVEDVQQ